MSVCTICPRKCGADRSTGTGFCGETDKIRIAKTMLHRWEEPCISGSGSDAGSGAVFFSGCSLKCVFCQNRKISRGNTGTEITEEQLAQEMLSLQRRGALNINLVTPTHFTLQIMKALDIAGDRLKIPVVWNTSGYENAETVRMLKGYAGIFLTDFKYMSPETAKRYSSAPDYPEVASAAVKEMISLTGKPVYKNGIMQSGTVVRILVLPGHRDDSIAVLDRLAQITDPEHVVLSLMAQYTPEFLPEGYPEINRRITTYEYEKVRDYANMLGFEGYSQDRLSADTSYTPDF